MANLNLIFICLHWASETIFSLNASRSLKVEEWRPEWRPAVIMSELKSTISIRVNDEQRQLIAAMWAHNDWELEIVGPSASDTVSEMENGEDHAPPPIPPLIPRNENEDECSMCLCKPCVTSTRFQQAWWPEEAHPPHRTNHKCRKPIYKRFWVMLANRGAWRDPRYVDKKQQTLIGILPDVAWVGPGIHPRDIMPDCVLKLVRTWFPNPSGQPYMGHLWQWQCHMT